MWGPGSALGGGGEARRGCQSQQWLCLQGDAAQVGNSTQCIAASLFWYACLAGKQSSAWGRTSGPKKRPPTFARPILAGCMTARNGVRGQAPDESFGEISKKPTEKDGSMQRQRCPEVDFRAADEPCSSPACLCPAPHLAALGPGIPDPPQATPPAAVRHLMPGSKLATFHGAPVSCSVLRFRGPLPRSLAVRVRRALQTLRALKCLSCFRVAVDCRSWLPHRQPILLPVSHWSGSGF